jgi:hypothetical protein
MPTVPAAPPAAPLPRRLPAAEREAGATRTGDDNGTPAPAAAPAVVDAPAAAAASMATDFGAGPHPGPAPEPGGLASRDPAGERSGTTHPAPAPAPAPGEPAPGPAVGDPGRPSIAGAVPLAGRPSEGGRPDRSAGPGVPERTPSDHPEPPDATVTPIWSGRQPTGGERGGELTAAGLMRRSPKQQIRNLAADGAQSSGRPPISQRSPEEVRQILSRYRTGLQRGRTTNPPGVADDDRRAPDGPADAEEQ